MTQNQAAYFKKQTISSGSRRSSFRQKLPLLSLFLVFIFISLTTIALIKTLHPKNKLYSLTEEVCLNNLELKSFEKTKIREHLTGNIHFSDFKISEQIVYGTKDDDFIVKLKLPVTDFYSALTDIPVEKVTDSDFLTQNQISFIDADTLSADKKLLSISGQHEDAGSGGTIGNAKQGWFDEEEEESSSASLFYSASQTMNSGSTGERSY